MLDDIRDAVRAQPWRSMGLALLAGSCAAFSRSTNPALRALADSTLATLLAAARKAVTNPHVKEIT